MKFKETILKTKNKVIFGAKKHSPEILIGAGVVGTVTAIIFACKSTLKLDEIIDERDQLVENIHGARLMKPDEYSEDDMKKDLTITHTKAAVKIVKLYSLPIAIEAVSIASILCGSHIIKKRFLAMSAAYSLTQESFINYRKRVAEKYGEDVDKELLYGLKKEEVTIEEVDKDGNVKEKKTKAMVTEGIEGFSPYAVYFDPKSCPECTGDDDMDKNTVEMYMSAFQDLLDVDKSVTLRDVYKSMKLKTTEWQDKAALVVGWHKDSENDRIIFSMFKVYVKDENGKAVPKWVIDFNVEGSIYDKMLKEDR